MEYSRTLSPCWSANSKTSFSTTTLPVPGEEIIVRTNALKPEDLREYDAKQSLGHGGRFAVILAAIYLIYHYRKPGTRPDQP